MKYIEKREKEKYLFKEFPEDMEKKISIHFQKP